MGRAELGGAGAGGDSVAVREASGRGSMEVGREGMLAQGAMGDAGEGNVVAEVEGTVGECRRRWSEA